MRLRRLLIEHYGCFERADLAFAAEPGRVNLVVAPNGAGKSVLRRRSTTCCSTSPCKAR